MSKHGYITARVIKMLNILADDVPVAKRVLDYMDYETFAIVQHGDTYWLERWTNAPVPRYVQEYLRKIIGERLGLKELE